MLPGVTVTLRGPAVPGAPTTVSNESGVYRFPNLAPGIYEISVELAGFATKTQTGIPVALGATQEVPVQMNVSTQQETITVVAESPVVDAATTEVSHQLQPRMGRERAGAALHVLRPDQRRAGRQPGNVRPARARSRSARRPTRTCTCSTAPTSPRRSPGAAWPWPNTDAIEEVQVLSLGATAEYGNVAGAVFNIVTRQGSNEFHGDANFYFQNQDLTGRNTDDDAGRRPALQPRPSSSTDHAARRADHKDKLWFFGSFQYQQDCESQPGTPTEFPAKSNAEALFLQVQLPDQPEQPAAVPARTTTSTRSPSAPRADTAPSTIDRRDTATTRRRA